MSRIINERTKMGKLNFSRVKNALKNSQNEKCYFVGGSLCLDFDDMPSIVVNLNGQGFSYTPLTSDTISKRICLTREMTNMVRQIYLDTKGQTEYFNATVKS